MKKEYLAFVIFPVSQCMILLGTARAAGVIDAWKYAGIVLSIAADVILFYVMLQGTQREKVERQLREVQYQREVERIRMEQMEERRQMLLSMQEEFESRFQSISEELEEGNTKSADQKLRALQGRLEETKTHSYCQNMIVNAVLDEKSKVCREMNAAFETELLVPGKLLIDPLHLCSIFANLLDNAIEAVRELDEPERQIRLCSEVKGNYLFVKVENAATRRHAEQKKREGRGNGVEILKSIARKYDGTYTAGYKNGIYTAVLAVKGIEESL